jgi:eukaryotic-like serine/threonine-protein kinase
MAVAGSIPKGTVLSGKYKVGRELGRGGMAAVYEALNVDIGKRVAIKLLAGHLATSQTVVERFLREARAVSTIRSPHICDVYDSGRLDDGTPFLVLELLEGESLYDAMCRERQMSPELTLAIILQVARGLQKAHEQDIVHRDLKPENIFLTADEDGQLLVKILDFGLAKFYDPITTGSKGKHARLTRDGAVFGTPAYMSPEQVRGQAAADTRADLWALACITYECFTGTTVWSTEDGVAMTFAQIATAPLPDPHTYRPDLPDTFTRWFRQALDRDINQRYQTVRDFADGLAAAFGYEGGGLDAALITLVAARAAGREPSTPSVRPPAPSGAEAASRPSAPQRKPPPPKRKPPAPPSQPSSSPTPVELRPELESIPTSMQPRSAAPKAIGGVLVGLVAVAAAVLLLTKEQIAVPDLERVGPTVRALAQREHSEASGFKYVADHPWLPMARETQALIAQGDFDRALGNLKRMHNEHRHGMIRNLMDQVEVAKAGHTGKAPCKVTGLSRPRRYDLVNQERKAVDAGPPVITQGLSGAMMAWTDSRDGQTRAYAVALDEALRNRSLEVDISPEGARVATPTLLPAAQRFVAAYSDAGGSSPGVYLRWLSDHGVIDGAPVAVAPAVAGSNFAHATRAADGGFIVAWADRKEADSIDIFYRRHGADAKPLGEPVRVTDYLNRGAAPTRVSDVQVAEASGKIHFAYVVQAGPLQQVRYLAIDAATAPPGLGDPPPGRRLERLLGEEIEISALHDKSGTPALGCVPDGCFVAWSQQIRGGAGVAYVEAKTGKRQWHKIFSARGGSPSIGTAASGEEARLVWMEGGRVATASLGREGVGPDSKIARVVGDQPPASVASGEKGTWYVTWLDYEAGHREPYAVRIRCE